MALSIQSGSPRHPAARALLEASHAYSAALYAPAENYGLSIDDLCQPDIAFFSAHEDGRTLGVCALAVRGEYAEAKSVFVAPEARGRGVARALMLHLIAEADARGLPLFLETGPLNTAALNLYSKLGFVRRGAFGDYPDSAASVFMQQPWLERQSPAHDIAAVHRLLVAAFASMDGVIDPPSSLHRLTVDALATEAERAELWVALRGPRACMILTPKVDTLYLGKLAVAAEMRGKGLARRMIDHAAERARALGLPTITLQTRVELTGNQAAFQRMGFVEIARTAHAGYTRPTSITYQRPA